MKEMLSKALNRKQITQNFTSVQFYKIKKNDRKK